MIDRYLARSEFLTVLGFALGGSRRASVLRRQMMGTSRSMEGAAGMMRIPHELRDEFPHDKALIDRLVRTDHEFERLATDYDEINRQIYLIESEEAPTADDVLERLKKRRLKLKDEIAETMHNLKRRM